MPSTCTLTHIFVSFTIAFGDGDRALPKPLEWGEFVTKMLPDRTPAPQAPRLARLARLAATPPRAAEPGPSSLVQINAPTGMLRTLPEVQGAARPLNWLVDGETLEISVTSTVPLRAHVFSSDDRLSLAADPDDHRQPALGIGVGPANIGPDQLTSTLSIDAGAAAGLDATIYATQHQIAASLLAGPSAAPVAYPKQTIGFAVTAPRFRLDGGDLASVFPPNLANGEFTGALPHAVLAKPVLPWLRTAYSDDDKGIEKASTPWLAVLTIQCGELTPPPMQISPIVSMTVADLVPIGVEFSLDPNWIEAFLDGALSIGRTTEIQTQADSRTRAMLRPSSVAAARLRRRNDRPHLAQLKRASASSPTSAVTGLLLRSQVVRGWPRLQIDGYSTNDDSHSPDVPKLRMGHLSPDVLLCLFDGAVAMVAIHEPPEQLHCGVEFPDSGGLQTACTTLPALNGETPGRQYPQGLPPQTGIAEVPLRPDSLTIQVRAAAASIQNALNAQFGAAVDTLTSNQFALELAKGVVRVEYAFEAKSHVQSA